MKSRVKLDDSAWQQIFVVLSHQQDIRIKDPKACRRFLNAVLWITRTGAQWRELPKRFGNWNSLYKRYRRWCQKGVWHRLLQEMSHSADLESLIPDSTMIRAHPCAAGKRGSEKHSLGGSCGGFSTKLHAVVDALGNPLRLLLTPGQTADISQGEALVAGYRAQQVIADKGYDCDAFVVLIEETGAQGVIPPRSGRLNPRDYDSHLYKERHLVECFFNKLKYYRRVFSHFDKTDECYLGFAEFASTLIWLR
ncbi:IS5 family transposase [Myxosarcina sp. GI1(2024)]